jgi:hypothetical protein
MVEFGYEKIKKIVYIYMLLPLWCFIALYLHSMLGAIFLLVLFFLTVMKIKVKSIWIRKRKRKKKVFRVYFQKAAYTNNVNINIKYLIMFAFVAVIWSFFGGQGNLYYQSADWGCRNAIYRDLIYMEWPVIYSEYDKALVYYIGYWLPSASVMKIIGLILPNIYLSELAFTIGNIFLWIWTSIGIFLTEVLLFTYAKPKVQYKTLLIPVILIFFSGMDIIGVIWGIVTQGKIFLDIHLEWWCEDLQFSSLTTCLFWVFNQTIVPWLAILCVLQEEKMNNFVFIAVCTFAAGPIPMVGIAVYMFFNGIYKGIYSIVNKEVRKFLGEVFSPINCLAVMILPVFLLYYKSNQALNNGVAGRATGVFSVFRFVDITDNFLKNVFLFLFLEAGVYLLLLYKKYKGDIFYYITIITLFIAPFIKIGGQSDFVARFSIPTVMVMAAMCLKYLVNYDIKELTDKANKYIYVALCICLTIGAVTPVTEFFRGYNAMLQNGKIVNVCDDIKTFNQDIPANNFTSHNYKSNIFFKYILSNK